MRIEVIQKEGMRTIEVTITSAPENPLLPRIIDRLQSAQARITAFEKSSATRRPIPLQEVAYLESKESYALVHTLNKEIYESPKRLFQLEAELIDTEFVRISRQIIVNFDAVVAILPELNSRLTLKLSNGEYVLVTRSYAKDIKRKLEEGT